MLSHPLTNFEIQKYYQNDPRFNGLYSWDNLPKIKNEAYIITLDEYSDIGSHWIALYVQNNDVTFFDSFGAEHIPEEIRKFIRNRSIKTNIFRIQAYDSIMCGYFCIGFFDFMLTGKTLTEFTNPFSPNNFIKNWWYNSKLFYDKCLKMTERSSTECNSIECNSDETHTIYRNLGVPLSDQQQFRPSKINEIKDYFIAEIKERELNIVNIASFDYFGKLLIVLSVTTGSISIASFGTVTRAPVGMVSASFSLAF